MSLPSPNFKVEAVEGEGGREFRLSGVIDEHADLTFLGTLRGSARINMRGVRRINSYGVRSWIDAVRKVSPECRFELVECPPPVIDQMNMVAGFVGKGVVTSFMAAMICGSCEHEVDQLFTVADCRKNGGKLPKAVCPACGKSMEVDDIEEQYLLFLRDH